MKKEFHIRRNRWGGFAGRSLITLVSVFALIVTIPFLSNAADRFDETLPCGLTVKVIEEFQDNLAGSDLVIDLYKVADVQPYTGSDGYYFELCSSYSGLTIEADMNSEKWSVLSQGAAEIALGAGGADMPVKTDLEIDKSVDGLEAGLYLLIARNKEADAEDYVDHVTITDGDKTESKIVTKAYVNEYVYIFSPELVSLPGKDPEIDENGEIISDANTASPGEWKYYMEVYLKPEQSSRYGSLKIVKKLENYNVSNGPATFVFDVEATLKGKNVYSNVVSIIFNDPGEEYTIVKNIPVGADVTVTEVYSGASYKVIGDSVKYTVIQADYEDTDETSSSVTFINDYDERQNGGHSITNKFKYEAGTETDTETQVRMGTWKLEQIYDMSQNEED